MNTYCLMNDKNTLKKVDYRTWCTKKPFSYRVIHQNSLISCSGHKVLKLKLYLNLNTKDLKIEKMLKITFI